MSGTTSPSETIHEADISFEERYLWHAIQLLSGKIQKYSEAEQTFKLEQALRDLKLLLAYYNSKYIRFEVSPAERDTNAEASNYAKSHLNEIVTLARRARKNALSVPITPKNIAELSNSRSNYIVIHPEEEKKLPFSSGHLPVPAALPMYHRYSGPEPPWPPDPKNRENSPIVIEEEEEKAEGGRRRNVKRRRTVRRARKGRRFNRTRK